MNKKIIFLLLIFLAAGFFLRLNLNTCMYGWDESSYLQNAEILGGFKKDNFNELNFRPILMSLVFAEMFKVYHDPIVANMLMTLLGTLSIFLIYKIGELMFNWKVGLVAAFVLAFNMAHIMLSQTLLMHVPALFFALCCLYLIKLGEQKNKLSYFALCAVCAALAILTRFIYAVLLPIFLVNLIIYRSKYDFKKIAVIAAVFTLTMAPYLIWNYTTFGDFLYTFKESSLVASWGLHSPMLSYFYIIPLLMGGLCIIGFVIWLASKAKKKISREEIFLIGWLVIFIVSSLKIPTKEVRYIFGALPAFVLLASLGFDRLFSWIKARKKFAVPITILLILAFAGASYLTNYPIIQKPACNSTLTQAANFLESLPMETVYTQHVFTQLAYYTDKKIIMAPFNKTRFLDPNDDYMNKEGYYVYFSEQQNVGSFAKPAELDSRFQLIKQFGNDSDAVFIFEYTPLKIIHLHEQNKNASEFGVAEIKLFEGIYENETKKICDAVSLFEKMGGESAEISYATIYAYAEKCGYDKEKYSLLLSEIWKSKNESWKSDALAGKINFDEYKLIEPEQKNLDSVTIGTSKFIIEDGMVVVSQTDRVTRDWLSGQLSNEPWNNGTVLNVFSEQYFLNQSELFPEIGWHEGGRIKQMQSSAKIILIPATATLAAKINNTWYAPDENGIFRFEVLDDKVNYPTTRMLNDDLALLIDTHGISSIVGQAVKNKADLVIGCCDSIGKIRAAQYLSSKNITVYCQTDRFVNGLIGSNLKVLGSAPIIDGTIGNLPFTVRSGEKIVVENAAEGGERYYDTPYRYITRLREISGIRLDMAVVNVSSTGEANKVTEKAAELGIDLVAIRVYNLADYTAVKNWLSQNNEHRAILLHSAAYPTGMLIFTEFPGQTTFGDIKFSPE